MRTTTFAGLALLAAASVACDGSPLQPDASTTAFDAARGRTGEIVTTPLRGRIAVVWNVDQSAAALAECPGTPGVAVGVVQRAELSGLGRVRSGSFVHCSVDLSATLPPDPMPPAPADIFRTGEWELVAADGSGLRGTYEFVFAPPEAGGYWVMRILDGSGRFAGAAGELAPDLERTEPPTCDDPLCLVNAFYAPLVEGEIEIPRPGH